MARLALITLIFATVINALLGLTVLLRAYRRAYGIYFGLTILGVVLWGIGDLGLLFSTDPRAVRLYASIFYIAPMIIPIFIWFFALSFPEGRKLPWPAPLLAGILFAVLTTLFLVDFDFFVKEISIQETLNISTPNPTGFLLYSSFFSVTFLLTYVAFFIKMRKVKGLNRTQVAYTFYGTVIASIPALLTNLSLPLMGVGTLIWLGPFFTLIFAISVTAAIVRHRLFNIRLVLARSIGYILSVGSLAAVYGFVAFAVVSSVIFRDENVSMGQQAVYTTLAVGVAFTFHPVRKFFEKITNHFFYRDAYNPSVFIDQLNKVLVSNTKLESMLKEAAFIIQSNLKSEFCVFGIEDARGRAFVMGTSSKQYKPDEVASVRHITEHLTDRVFVADTAYQYESRQDNKLATILTKNNISVLARLVPAGQEGKKALGYLLLGNKKSGNSYTTGDITIIEIIVNALVIAIENALRFQEIESFNVTLQEKIEGATRELRSTNQKLRSLDRTKDDFISMASHQLRTPLTSVKGYVSMVLDGDAGRITPLQRKLLNQSFISSQRMVYLISDLLNVSRLRTGKFIIEPVKTNLAQVIRGEIDQLVETAKGRNLELTFNKPEHFPSYMLDETKLRQVIMNFIDNAIYYTPSGGKIAVNLVEKPQSIEFTVLDTGMGVPKKDQPHLFTKFFRAGNAKRARPDGTGLGLFMAKKVVIAQGGAIIFKSQEGKGSMFGFTFSKDHLEEAK